MKSKHLFIAVVSVAFSLVVAFNLGSSYNNRYHEAKAKQEAEQIIYEMKGKIVNRYFEEIGNPQTKDEHCRYMRIVFGECDE